ncbi:MAG: hypothetical protein Q7T57_06410, partial [Dehalococcoidales bacterium]|nr:hypothetical protein [Dehalococcoidales bacterium]
QHSSLQLISSHHSTAHCSSFHRITAQLIPIQRGGDGKTVKYRPTQRKDIAEAPQRSATHIKPNYLGSTEGVS